MTNRNALMLESMISVAINAKYPDVPPNEEEFMAEATDLRGRLGLPVSDEEFEQIVKNLKAALLVAMDVGVSIVDPDSTHQSWLPARRSEIDFFYWNRYKKYLETVKGWNTRVTANLDTVSTEILDLLGDPKNDQTWKRKGLVIGDVQSGKTANFTAICNKAADTGYKVIIVLAGLTDSLRIQTQERLDKEFSGRLSKHLLNTTSNREIRNVFDGVGKIDARKRIMAFTTGLIDFNATVLRSNDLTIKNLTEPALFVVKKNSRILSNLERWLRQNNEGQDGLIDMPLLLIDDEADNASVNTQRQDQEATAVNRAIRSILNRFTKASYLGITATPFANIFIDPEQTDEKVGDDLFPRDFIYLLSPPSSYIGADAIYSDDAPYRHVLEEIDAEQAEAFFPLKHKKDLVVDELPIDLCEALGYFVLINAIRDLRGDVTEHRSMLVNVSRFTDVQMRIKDTINEWLVQVRSDVSNYAGLDEEQALKISSLKFLREVWDKHELSARAKVPWIEIQQKYLNKAIGPVQVRAVNQKTGAASLDYYAHKEGFRVIAVGGNSLSRGLTLEGLCVSYFYRNSRMYDTLLQMGRWFGYRPNFDDLFKIWMTREAIDWYEFINSAANELKDEVRVMNAQRRSPRDFGLKVRRHPDALTVTALNKMRTAATISVPVSVHGRLLETPRLKTKPEILAANEKAFKLFVAHMDSIGTQIPSPKGLLWSGIPKQLVVDLLNDFETHQWHLSFQGRALAAFIERASNLDEWDVVVPQGRSGKIVELEGAQRQIDVLAQTRTVDEVDGMIRINRSKVRVGAGGLTQAGLTKDEIEIAEKAFKKKGETKNPPDRIYLTKGRKPLLMLHVLSTQQEGTPSNKIPEILYALGVGLPQTDDEEITADYAINLVEQRNWMDSPDDGDEEDAN